MRECDVDVSLPQLVLHPERYKGRRILLVGVMGRPLSRFCKSPSIGGTHPRMSISRKGDFWLYRLDFRTAQYIDEGG